MRVITENRKGNNVYCYIIDITEVMKSKALNFANEIIRSNNQYSRLVPNVAKTDPELQQKLEIQRTYVGKLGELAFLEYLHYCHFYPNIEDMFKIYPGQGNTDGFDFEINGRSIDIKTGFRPIHKKLLINMQQFTNTPKNFYVAVHLNGKDSHSEQKTIDLNSITEATIKGYADWYDLNNQDNNVGNFGEGLAKFRDYNRLFGIDGLLNQLGLTR